MSFSKSSTLEIRASSKSSVFEDRFYRLRVWMERQSELDMVRHIIRLADAANTYCCVPFMRRIEYIHVKMSAWAH